MKRTVEQAEEQIRIRLNAAVHAQGHSPKSLAWKTGISESVIRAYLQDGVVPTAGRLAVLCETLKVNPAQILGFEGGEPHDHKAAGSH